MKRLLLYIAILLLALSMRAVEIPTKAQEIISSLPADANELDICAVATQLAVDGFPDLALEYHTKAAEMGNARSMLYVGNHYFNAGMENLDEELLSKGAEWYLKGVGDPGCPALTYNAVMACMYGLGMELDVQKAIDMTGTYLELVEDEEDFADFDLNDFIVARPTSGKKFDKRQIYRGELLVYRYDLLKKALQAYMSMCQAVENGDKLNALMDANRAVDYGHPLAGPLAQYYSKRHQQPPSMPKLVIK